MDRLRAEDPRFRESLKREGYSYRDERIRTVYAIGPVLGPALEKQSLTDIAVPVRLVVGNRDRQARPEVTAEVVAASVPEADLLLLPGVAHYTFLASCRPMGRVVLRELCSDPRGTNRRKIHRQVGDDAVAHFRRVLLEAGEAAHR